MITTHFRERWFAELKVAVIAVIFVFPLCLVASETGRGVEQYGSQRSLVRTATEIELANHSYQGSCEVVPKCESLCLELRDVNKRYNECRGHKTKKACSSLVVERMRTYYSFIGCAMYHDPKFRLH